MKISCSRWHEIDCGHRVVGQGGKCEMIHGHRYRIEFHARAKDWMDLSNADMTRRDNEGRNEAGMIIDFGVIKERLCKWLDDFWDHRYLCFIDDPQATRIMSLNLGATYVDFNPTAENIAAFLLHTVAPKQVHGTGVEVWRVVVHETLKCHAEAEL